MSDLLQFMIVGVPIAILVMVASEANKEHEAKLDHRKEQLRLQRRANNLAAREAQDRKELEAKSEILLQAAAVSFRRNQRRYEEEMSSTPNRSLKTTPVRPISVEMEVALAAGNSAIAKVAQQMRGDGK